MNAQRRASTTLGLAGKLRAAWQPPGIDHAKPAVASGVPCPSGKVADEAGQRVEQLVNDVGKFAAVEDLLHERLDEMGNPTTKENRKFDYSATISKGKTLGVMEVDEYRTQRYGTEGLPDHIADHGFAAWALVFHPAMRDAFQVICEGLGEWRGQATWLVHFQQRRDQPNHIHGYIVGSRIYPVDMKGRAWITADKFQVVRIESEMISPLPEIQLLAEHQITEYGPVPFAAKNVELWLPKSVEVYLHFRGRRYYRRHTFERFMLFSVTRSRRFASLNPIRTDRGRPTRANANAGRYNRFAGGPCWWRIVSEQREVCKSKKKYVNPIKRGCPMFSSRSSAPANELASPL
jgi:hypothetical protein